MDRDRYPRARSPDRRYPPRDSDGYRTPPRGSIDRYHGGPPRRYDDSYSRDARPRSPSRRDYADTRYDDRTRPPLRERSPSPLKRGREPSPVRGMRSPPRDYARPRSPPRPAYRPRSRSPRREDRLDPYTAKTWRRRSPSPRGRSGGGSGRDSVASSRLSSPRPYQRATNPYAGDDFRAPPTTHRSPRPRSSPRRDAPPPRPRSPRQEDPYASRPRAAVEDAQGNGSAYPPTAPTDYRDRAPPTGPAAVTYRDPSVVPPTGPAASAPVSMSAHNRPGSTQPPNAPSYAPRGGYRGRGGPREYPSRDFSGPPHIPRGRGSWGGPSFGGRGRGGFTPRDPYTDPSVSHDPRGPPRRESFGFHSRGGPTGVGSSSSLTTPHTQRFNTAIQDVPKIKEGGEKLASLHDTTKADRLEEEAARLRKLIDDKETKKRQSLREWERLDRETVNATLRAELAGEHLKSITGEDGMSTAAF